MAQPTILTNLKRCTGCWTCAMACKVAYKLPQEKWWLYVKTLGDGSGIDEPAGEYPDLKMSWIPMFTQDCILCAARTKNGEDPYCVYNCPTKALTYGDLDDPNSAVSVRMKELKEKGYKVFKLPAWEKTRPEVVYAEK